MIAEWLEKKGEKKGSEAARLEIAQRLFSKGFDIGFVSDLTGLVDDDLKHLMKST